MQTCRYCTFYMASCMANNYRLLVDIFHGDLRCRGYRQYKEPNILIHGCHMDTFCFMGWLRV